MRFPWSRPEEALRVRSRMAGKQEEFWTCQLEFARGMSKRPGNRKDSGPVSWNRVRKSPKTRETVSYLDIYTNIAGECPEKQEFGSFLDISAGETREKVQATARQEGFWTFLAGICVKWSNQLGSWQSFVGAVLTGRLRKR